MPTPRIQPRTQPLTQPLDTAASHALHLSLLGAALCLLPHPTVHAEGAPERGVVALKYLDYLDSQPDADRIRVRATALNVMAPIAGEWKLSGNLVSDTISGASPAFHTAALTKMHDLRRAADTEVTRYFPDGSLTVGAAVSSESDYLSRELSFSASRSSEDKNTTWSAGLGLSRDRINPNNHVTRNETKQVNNFLLSVTQTLSQTDLIQFNLGVARGSGYFSDPYKVLDQRPRERNTTTLMTRWNHFISATEGTLRSSYRYYRDSWDIRAHTLGLEYVQPVAHGWTITPLVRLYSQSAARFYVPAEPDESFFAPNPPEGARHFSEDQRVSAFGAHTFGIKLAKQLNADWQVDLKFEQYAQRGAWRLFGDGSTNLANFKARTFQAGIARQF